MKKCVSVILTSAILLTVVFCAVPAAAAQTKVEEVAQYSYKITPLLQPFNQFFFVKTDNPNPKSFRFIDQPTVYDAKGAISFSNYAFADIHYDNPETMRVNGGYIFRSSNKVDGGEIMLQAANVKNESDYQDYDRWHSGIWVNTGKTFTLPRLMDVTDYLIETYAAGDSFFDKMDAVQKGFSSVCLYDGSNLRGTLERINDYWMAAAVGHVDQSLYIYSPYDRKGSKALLATAVYPFRFDSIGFPQIMIKVSERLDSTSTHQWNENYHYLVDITCDGVTKSYGGAGNGEGQGINEENIEYLSFGDNGTTFTLDNTRERLERYAKLPIEDDVPHDDELTWKQIADTVGEGAWVRVVGNTLPVYGKHDASKSVYTYLYSERSGTHFAEKEFGVGDRMYRGGDLGYTKDTWVDGRYVGIGRRFVPGATFEDHPTSDLLFSAITVPQIEYDYVCNNYVIKSITEKPQRALFRYDDELQRWIIDSWSVASGCADYEKTAEMVEWGLVAPQYLDKMTLTKEQVAAMHVDKNTNVLPPSGYVFDGILPCGTPFHNLAGGDVNGDGTVDVSDATVIQLYIAELLGESTFIQEAADVNGDGIIAIDDATHLQQYVAELIPAL
ncbi:MAG: dockerin type I repeat-containing protein [Ruminococcus sp.]